MRSADQLADRLAFAALAAFALVAALSFRDYGLGWDDYTHSEYGDLLLALYGSGFKDQRALSFVNLYMYGGGFDMVAALFAKILPFTLFETRRLVGALVGLIGYALTWRIGRRVGGPFAGLFALLFLLTCPHYYGHVFMNAKDIPFAVATLALLLGCVRVIDDYPAPSRMTVIVLGLGLGFAFGSRILAAVSVIGFAVTLLFMLAVEFSSAGPRAALHRFGQAVLTLMPAAGFGYLVMGLLWPWSILSPLNPLLAVEYFSRFFEKPWNELYEGALVSVPDMPASYVPHLFLLKLPEAMLAFGVAGTAIAIIAVGNGRLAPRRRAAWLLLITAAWLPVAVAIVTRPALYNGIRHFLFVIPPLAILAGLAAAQLRDRLSRSGRAARIALGIAFAAMLALPISDMMRLHPYEYAHFNRLAGGIRGAEQNYMLDYWGLAFKEASEDLRDKLAAAGERPPGRPWVVAICGPQRPAQVALGADFVTSGDPRGADFALSLGAFYCRDLKLPVLAEVRREDVILARAYDLRGRSVRDLLTLPPP